MGGVFSSLGFNQPFFFTIIGIILLLAATSAFVADSQDDSKPDLTSEMEARYQPQLRVNVRTPLDKATTRSREARPMNIY